MATKEAPENDLANVNGSGYGYGDIVTVEDGETGNPVKAVVQGIHKDGKSLDVRYDQRGHKLHGAVRKVSVDIVKDVSERTKAKST
jgi:hypothetical protein